MPMPIVCNEPVASLTRLRSPRIWLAMLNPDLPGKLVLTDIQLHHGHTIFEDAPNKFDKQLLALYTKVIETFSKRHGESTKCFIARAPESLDLVGIHVQEFGGATNGIACLETVFCVSPRDDGKVAISHVDDRFPAAEFGLLDGLPKARVLEWREHAAKNAGNAWTDTVRNAIQSYVNRHKGPTGQVELPIPGLNIVVGAALPEGLDTHSATTLAAASLVSAMAATGEWGKVSLADVAEWVRDAEAGARGRRSPIGPIVFGMPGEIIHTDWNPARAKGRNVAPGHVVISAHTGLEGGGVPAANASERSTTTFIGLALFRQHVAEALAQGGPCHAQIGDGFAYGLLQRLPESITRTQALEAIKSAEVREQLKARFAAHAEPSGGYPIRAKALFVLAEMARAAYATDVLRRNDPAELGALMNIAQVGESNNVFRVTAGGLTEDVFEKIICTEDGHIDSLIYHGDSLWRQAGHSGASSKETDLLAELAFGVPGVLGARYVEPQRVAILCKVDAVVSVQEKLSTGYYTPRGLPATLAMMVVPARGVGIIDP